jgi:hypothetical protein
MSCLERVPKELACCFWFSRNPKTHFLLGDKTQLHLSPLGPAPPKKALTLGDGEKRSLLPLGLTVYSCGSITQLATLLTLPTLPPLL